MRNHYTKTSGLRLLIAALIQSPALALAQPPASIDGADGTTMASIHAQGAQIYQCQPDVEGRLTWQFREPVATLLDAGKTVGRHYAGPSWELTDGTVLTAKVVARAQGASESDIPWLRLSVVRVRGSGPLAEATTIRRHNTRGGVASGMCASPGAFLSVPYSADYTFLKEFRHQ